MRVSWLENWQARRQEALAARQSLKEQNRRKREEQEAGALRVSQAFTGMTLEPGTHHTVSDYRHGWRPKIQATIDVVAGTDPRWAVAAPSDKRLIVENTAKAIFSPDRRVGPDWEGDADVIGVGRNYSEWIRVGETLTQLVFQTLDGYYADKLQALKTFA